MLNLIASPEMSKAYSVPEKTKGGGPGQRAGNRAILSQQAKTHAWLKGQSRLVSVLRCDMHSVVTWGTSTSWGKSLGSFVPNMLNNLHSRSQLIDVQDHLCSVLVNSKTRYSWPGLKGIKTILSKAKHLQNTKFPLFTGKSRVTIVSTVIYTYVMLSC